MLLARRLIEAGVRLVHVNWTREGGDSAVDNPMWDTHAQNAERLQDVLCPQFDVGFTALLEDLEQRGLLHETLVVAIGEFGRTPRINGQGGRDHWGPVFSFALAGAGIAGGQVFGSSDKNGAYPATDPVRPHDLTATIYHLLGIDPQGTFQDRSGQPHLLTKGEPLYRVLGTGPATPERHATRRRSGLPAALRCQSAARCRFPIQPTADPRPAAESHSGLAGRAALAGSAEQRPERATARRGPAARGPRLRHGRWLRAAPDRSGQPRHSGPGDPQRPRRPLHLHGARQCGGARADYFDKVFLANFSCRLVLFRFADIAKDPRRVQELASASFRPVFTEAATAEQTFSVARFLGSTQPGANFPIGNGLGVAVVVEKTTTGILTLPREGRHRVLVRVHSAKLDFSARPRDDSVTE